MLASEARKLTEVSKLLNKVSEMIGQEAAKGNSIVNVPIDCVRCDRDECSVFDDFVDLLEMSGFVCATEETQLVIAW